MLPEIKSYTSIYEIFGSYPFNNVLYKNPKKGYKERLPSTKNCGDSETKTDIKQSLNFNHATSLVTSENYHHLNKDVSYKSVVRSNSTIFYDLDDISKRHSFHCLTELSISHANLLKVLKIPEHTNVLGGKSEAIVQECATQIKPKHLARDSIEINVRKAKRKVFRDSILSSAIFLRDEENTNNYNKNQYYEKYMSDNQQKFWSYAKYKSECTNPVTEVKKHKKKEKEKHTEDPCPCQLFSYACPCTDKKSLTELAKSSKSITVIDQLTSTTNVFSHETKELKKKSIKRQKLNKLKEEKPTSINPIETAEGLVHKNISKVNEVNNHDTLNITNLVDRDLRTMKSRQKSYKKSRKIICPNCKEKVEILSTTEEEENLKCDSSTYSSREMSPTAAYTCRASPSKIDKYKIEDESDIICSHKPRCEMVPVCQILPCDDNYSSKINKSQTNPKQNTRVIRITKACRHHPPCTVVPSCQRANVLKNNCEYIPPCLHQPRCVNLPLCVPFSKSMHYEEVNKHVDGKESVECPHVPRCKYLPICQHDSLINNVSHQMHMVPQMQHACEFMNGYQTPGFLLTPQSNCITNSYSPYQVPSPNTCSFKPSKSCQYDSTENKSNTFNGSKVMESNEMVVFIRDVGCQFRNKNYSPKESVLQSKNSISSINFVDDRTNKYYTDVHTLRYEDKYTNLTPGEELSVSSESMSASIEINTHSPLYEHRVSRESPRSRHTGFSPDAAYVTAYSINDGSTTTAACTTPNINEMSKCNIAKHHPNAASLKSRRSFLNHKYKKIYNRRKKCKSSRHNINVNRSKHIVYHKKFDKNSYI